jgi:hypothetical protein
MALVPALDPVAPNDAFLFTGNDSDFLTNNGKLHGRAFDAGLKNDTFVLADRLTLPGDVAKTLAAR